MDCTCALVQKSGYFGRTADPNSRDLDLIRRLAVVRATAGVNGVAGLDEDNGGEVSVIVFLRINWREAIRRRDTVVWTVLASGEKTRHMRHFWDFLLFYGPR